MTAQQIRLECLRLTSPSGLSNPDVDRWIDRARQIEEYVVGEGQGIEPLKKRRGRPPKAQADNPVDAGPVGEVHELV